MDDNQGACLFCFILCMGIAVFTGVIGASVNYYETSKMEHQYKMAVVAHPDALIWDDDAKMWVKAQSDPAE